MSKAPSKYRRCSNCKELISAHHVYCPNCENKNPLAWKKPNTFDGQKSSFSPLDWQDGTNE